MLQSQVLGFASLARQRITPCIIARIFSGYGSRANPTKTSDVAAALALRTTSLKEMEAVPNCRPQVPQV